MNKQKQNIMKMIRSLIKEDAKSLTKANIALSECLAEKVQDQFGEEGEMELSFDTESGDVNAESELESQPDELDSDDLDNQEAKEGSYCPGCGIEVEKCCCDEEAPFCSGCGELKTDCQCDDHSHEDEDELNLGDEGMDDSEMDDSEMDDSEMDDSNTHSDELEQILKNLKGE